MARLCEVKSLSRVRLFETPWAVTPRLLCPWDSLTRQGYWSGLLFPSPGDLPAQEWILGLLHCRQILYRLCAQRSPVYSTHVYSTTIKNKNKIQRPSACVSGER